MSHIENIQRNESLERSIDFKNFINHYRPTSISVIIDTIDYFLKQYESNKDLYSRKELYNFLKNNSRLIINRTENLTLEEIDYIEYIESYIIKIRKSIGLDKYFFKHMISDIIAFITNEIELDSSIDDIVGIVNKSLHYIPNTSIHLDKTPHSVTIYIHDIKHKIHIVNNPGLFSINDIENNSSIILNNDYKNLIKEINKNSKIRLIAYRQKNKYRSFRIVDCFSPIEECIYLMYTLIYRKTPNLSDFENKFNHRLDSIMSALQSLETKIPYYSFNIDDSTINDIKLLRTKVHKALYIASDIRNCKETLYKIEKLLSLFFNNIMHSINLERNVLCCISEIKRNNSLYIVSKSNKKVVDFAFGEENLSSILASNLRCMYHNQKYISVHCESTVGNGRSDIRINLNSSTIGLIESKLLRSSKTSNVNYEKETRNGIEQLFFRYSENEHLIDNKHIELFLVLFSYDSNFRNLLSKIKNAISTYVETNKLHYEKISNNENCIKFMLTEQREEYGFINKSRIINIVVCNLEIDYKTKSKERTKK